jgi:hypothetical protein
MRARLLLRLSFLAILLLALVDVSGAAGATWGPVSLDATGCNVGAIRFTNLLSGVTFPTTLRFRTLVDAGGIRYMDEDAGTPGSVGNYVWSLYFANNGGPAQNAWPIPNDTPIVVQFLLIDGVEGPIVTRTETRLSKCNGGTILPIVNVIGAGPGGGPHVRLIDRATGLPVRDFFAYNPAFTGGVHVALGDVNGDGIPDVVTGAGPGGGAHVRVFDGVTGAELHSFLAYPLGFTGGVFVATMDVNGDGKADIITGAGPGGGPHVRVFDGATGAEIQSYFAFSPGFTGGVFVGGE